MNTIVADIDRILEKSEEIEGLRNKITFINIDIDLLLERTKHLQEKGTG